tara:strand:- start:170 stop:865 length:696 start_codon:yes stop_codon:yes gene_type:complete
MSTLNVGTVNAATVNYTGDSTSSTSANRSLEDMTNVSGTPGTNQSLIWNGSAWAPATNQQNVVKIWAHGGTTVNQTISSRRGTSTSNMTYINGTEVDCGTPQGSNNWHRVYWWTVTDDSGGPSNPDGFGFGLYRNVNNGGWSRILDMGSHSHYVNGLSDWYEIGTFFAYVPVVNNTQNHKYRIYMDRHNDVNYRVNCGIGDDYRRNGWNNAVMEVWEIDNSNFSTNSFTRY